MPSRGLFVLCMWCMYFPVFTLPSTLFCFYCTVYQLSCPRIPCTENHAAENILAQRPRLHLAHSRLHRFLGCKWSVPGTGDCFPRCQENNNAPGLPLENLTNQPGWMGNLGAKATSKQKGSETTQAGISTICSHSSLGVTWPPQGSGFGPCFPAQRHGVQPVRLEAHLGSLRGHLVSRWPIGGVHGLDKVVPELTMGPC